MTFAAFPQASLLVVLADGADWHKQIPITQADCLAQPERYCQCLSVPVCRRQPAPSHKKKVMIAANS